jgi:hypothetical protein
VATCVITEHTRGYIAACYNLAFNINNIDLGYTIAYNTRHTIRGLNNSEHTNQESFFVKGIKSSVDDSEKSTVDVKTTESAYN